MKKFAIVKVLMLIVLAWLVVQIPVVSSAAEVTDDVVGVVESENTNELSTEDNKSTRDVEKGVAKSDIRNDLAIVVSAGKELGFTTAAYFLNHSLNDNPSNLVLGSGTKYAKQIMNSASCIAIVDDFRELVTGKSWVAKTVSGSTTLNSTTDLMLAYNKVNYTIKGTYSNGTWTLTIVFTDTQDFDPVRWNTYINRPSVAAVLNNYGAYAQEMGAIVPYSIKVNVATSFHINQLNNIDDEELS